MENNKVTLDIFIDEVVSVLLDFEDPISKGTMWTGKFIGFDKGYIFLSLRKDKKYSIMIIPEKHILDILVYKEKEA